MSHWRCHTPPRANNKLKKGHIRHMPSQQTPRFGCSEGASCGIVLASITWNEPCADTSPDRICARVTAHDIASHRTRTANIDLQRITTAISQQKWWYFECDFTKKQKVRKFWKKNTSSHYATCHTPPRANNKLKKGHIRHIPSQQTPRFGCSEGASCGIVLASITWNEPCADTSPDRICARVTAHDISSHRTRTANIDLQRITTAISQQKWWYFECDFTKKQKVRKFWKKNTSSHYATCHTPPRANNKLKKGHIRHMPSQQTPRFGCSEGASCGIVLASITWNEPCADTSPDRICARVTAHDIASHRTRTANIDLQRITTAISQQKWWYFECDFTKKQKVRKFWKKKHVLSLCDVPYPSKSQQQIEERTHPTHAKSTNSTFWLLRGCKLWHCPSINHLKWTMCWHQPRQNLRPRHSSWYLKPPN